MLFHHHQFLRIAVFFLWLISTITLISGNETNFASGMWFDETGETATSLDTGWKFQFVKSDTSTRFAESGLSDSASAVSLPHIFPSDKPGGQPLCGYGWYYKEIVVQHADIEGKDVSLSFKGACLRADVFVNGNFAGGCTYAYNPFSVDLTPYLQKSDLLRIAVRIDSRLMTDQIPDPAAKGWWIYGGLCREVYIVTRRTDRIEGIQVRTFFRNLDTFDLQCALEPSHLHWDSVSVTVKRQDTRQTIAKFTFTGNDSLVSIGSVRAWTPEDPFRYELQFVPWFRNKKGAEITMLRGFCQLSTNGPRILLNGKPYYLKGISRHDFVRLDGTPPTREQRRIDLLDIKSMGANFLRIAHFPQHSDIYELCDSIGLLVMDEMPAWKTSPKFLGSEAGRKYGSAYMQDLIKKHGNYTSICIWSVGNQIGSYKTSVADFVGAVTSVVKRIDPSRLVTFCSYLYMWDKAFKSLDIIAINEYFGWELASLDMLPPLLDEINKDWPDKPVVVSEIGAQCQYGLRNPKAKLAGPIKCMIEKDLSEDHHALFIGAHMDTIRTRKKFVNGIFIWSYNDYMSNMNKKHAAGTPKGFNCCGVVTVDREKKMSYEEIRKRYTTWQAASEDQKIGTVNAR
jgi:beta-galactosidase/beta-glucuronidase